MTNNPVSGNFYDKYNSRNLIVRYLMNGFLSSFDEMVSISHARSVRELGCGEGYLSIRLSRHGRIVSASDLSEEVIEQARMNAVDHGAGVTFRVEDAHNPSPSTPAHDLVVCCEVLEHLDDPLSALDKISKLGAEHYLFSVPNEPLWRLLNMARGKYLSNFGNTPGHINHWSPSGFVSFISKRFDVKAIRRPVPWTMILCSPRKP